MCSTSPSSSCFTSKIWSLPSPLPLQCHCLHLNHIWLVSPGHCRVLETSKVERSTPSIFAHSSPFSYMTSEHTMLLYSCICLSTGLPASSLPSSGGPSSTSLIALFLPHHTAEKANELYHSHFKTCCRTPTACRTEHAVQSCPSLPFSL